ncbi:MAG: S8/S53 family peptidase, partial [Thermoanaerobaculia bacterium]
ITSRLALPIISFNAKLRKHSEIDPVHGGFLGLQSQLAEAIQAEVRDWHDRPPQVRERHLVLNLSLAWDGELFGGLNDEEVAEMRAGTQAVYRVLQYANELDVLVLAAAGNQKRAPCLSNGPLVPAAWERGILREESCGEPRSTPLLYAVGGIESEGRPLLNARQGGMPRRVAYGENAVVECPSQQGYTATLTGSSVSTAVVSSVATVVWSYFPELTPQKVMDILDGSGEELHGFQTNFWFNGIANRPVVHRISLCTALKEACNQYTSTSCPIIKGPCAPWGPESLTASSHSQSRILGRDSCNPWLYPQPDDTPCPNCSVEPPPRQN